MIRYKIASALGAVCLLCVWATAQEKAVLLQSPRQAVLEMLTGGEGFKKHLTVEVQQRLSSPPPRGQMNPADLLGMVDMAKSTGGDDFQSFESGPVLFSYNNAQQQQKIEVRLDGDDLHGDADDLNLSFRWFRGGKEDQLPVAFHVVLGLKYQEHIWRLNAITFSAVLPVGDPKLLDNDLWKSTAAAGAGEAGPAPEAAAAPPKITAARSMRMIGLAENKYSQKHPAAGFTCNFSDLVNIGKGTDNGQSYTFLDPEFAGGVYNGYRFALSGCAGRPIASFSVVAEPLAGGGRAYCSDETHTLRGSDDGKGATCLASGKVTYK